MLRVHPGALGDLIDGLLVRAQGYARNFGVIGPECGKDGAVGGIVSCCEPLFDR